MPLTILPLKTTFAPPGQCSIGDIITLFLTLARPATGFYPKNTATSTTILYKNNPFEHESLLLPRWSQLHTPFCHELYDIFLCTWTMSSIIHYLEAHFPQPIGHLAPATCSP